MINTHFPEPTGDELLVSNQKDLALRIQRRIGRGHHSGPELNTTHLEEGAWKNLFDGVEVKLLRQSTSEEVSLWRLAKESSLPSHHHPDDEECVLLDGDLWVDGEFCEQGAYHYAAKGSEHKQVYSPSGALFLLRRFKDRTGTVKIHGHTPDKT